MEQPTCPYCDDEGWDWEYGIEEQWRVPCWHCNHKADKPDPQY